MSKADDMRRLIDLANNNKIVLETYGENESNPFKAFSSWGKVSEAGMPASVIKSKEKIRYATDEENKQRFAGKTLEELRSMAWRHGYGKGSKEYDKFHDGVTGMPLDEDLHKWFKEKWVRFGPDGKIRGDCARDDDSEGKPKCLPQSKAHSVGKKARASAAARKRRKDPNADRSGKAINVNTKKKKSNESVEQCPHCDGPMYHESMMNEKQDACYHKVKSRYKIFPSAYASGALVQCRKKGAKNWGNKSESVEEAMKPEHATGKEKSGAVEVLEKRLLSAKKRGSKLDYDSIDEMMQRVCDDYNLTGDKLHNDFVKKHHLVPDKWIVTQVDEAANLAQQAAIAIKTKKD